METEAGGPVSARASASKYQIPNILVTQVKPATSCPNVGFASNSDGDSAGARALMDISHFGRHHVQQRAVIF